MSISVNTVQNRDVRDILTRATEFGWEIDRYTSSGHLFLRNVRTGKTATVASTPSDYRGLKNMEIQLGLKKEPAEKPPTEAPAVGHLPWQGKLTVRHTSVGSKVFLTVSPHFAKRLAGNRRANAVFTGDEIVFELAEEGDVLIGLSSQGPNFRVRKSFKIHRFQQCKGRLVSLTVTYNPDGEINSFRFPIVVDIAPTRPTVALPAVTTDRDKVLDDLREAISLVNTVLTELRVAGRDVVFELNEDDTKLGAYERVVRKRSI